jgi:phage shock protein B
MDGYTFTFLLILLVLLYRLAVLGLRRRSRGVNDSSAEQPVSEVDLLRELHQGLCRMEKRIEALETLLADRDQGDRAPIGEKRAQ